MSNQLVVKAVKSISPPSQRTGDENHMHKEWILLTVSKPDVFKRLFNPSPRLLHHARLGS